MYKILSLRFNAKIAYKYLDYQSLVILYKY